MSNRGGGMEPSVDGHTHPVLAELQQKACSVVDLFDQLPSVLQMDGLDMLQGVVNSVIQKITAGRVTAVKFVPVAGTSVNGTSTSSAQIRRHVKQEIRDEDYHDNDSNDSGDFQDNQATHHASMDGNQEQQRKSRTNSLTHSNSNQNIVITNVCSTSPKAKSKAAKKSSRKKPSKAKSKSKNYPALKIQLSPIRLPQGSGVVNVSPNELKSAAKKKKADEPQKKTAAKKTKISTITKYDHSVNEAVDNEDKEDIMTEDTKLTVENGSKANTFIGKDDGSAKSKEEIRAMFPADFWIQAQKKRKVVKGNARFECSDCEYKTNVKFHYDSHRIKHTKEKKYACDICDKVYTAASTLKRHKFTHQSKEARPFPCPVCTKRFIDLPSLRTHAVVHTGEKLYPCPVEGCTKVYTCHSNLSRHKRVHTGEMPYVCKYEGCGVKYRDQSSLRLHHLKHTGEKPCVCKFCGMAFRTSSDKLRHERTHTKERNFECKVCNKTFVQGWHVKQHMRMHDDVRPYKCELCDKRMRTKASLEHHMRMHAGIKRFTCETCGKMFTTKAYLASHQVIHTKDRPFKCKTCGTSFNQISNLKRHERMHSDVIRYKCRYCDKGFKYINSWRYHEQSIHEGIQHQCDQCGISFRCKRSMKLHRCEPSALLNRSGVKLVATEATAESSEKSSDEENNQTPPAKGLKVAMKSKAVKNNKRKGTTPVKRSLKLKSRKLSFPTGAVKSETGTGSKVNGEISAECSQRNLDAENGNMESTIINSSGDTTIIDSNEESSQNTTHVIIKQEPDDSLDGEQLNGTSNSIASPSNTIASPSHIVAMFRNEACQQDMSAKPNAKLNRVTSEHVMTSYVNGVDDVSGPISVPNVKNVQNLVRDDIDVSALGDNRCNLDGVFNSPSKNRAELTGWL